MILVGRSSSLKRPLSRYDTFKEMLIATGSFKEGLLLHFTSGLMAVSRPIAFAIRIQSEHGLRFGHFFWLACLQGTVATTMYAQEFRERDPVALLCAHLVD